MGQTLTNGIFLPNEGERNCYTGLESNWRAIDGYIGNYNVHAADLTIHVTAADKEAWNGKADASALNAHTGDATIHVTAADKEAWNGKADASALTAHTGDTTIHVTAADKEAWNGKADASALTAHTGDTTIHVTAEDKTAWNGKANDTDAVHKSGAETIGGLKTFTDLLSIDGDYLGTEASTNQRTNLQLRSNRDTPGKSGALLTRFRQNKSQGGLLSGDLQMFGIDFLENEVRTSNVLSIQASGWGDSVPTKVNIISAVNEYSFGNSVRPCRVNGINPGALSLPNLSRGVDISSYFSTGTVANQYTAPADGWICLLTTSSSNAAIYWNDSNNLVGSVSFSAIAIDGSQRVTNCMIPANKNVVYDIVFKMVGTIISAKFFPCLGNI